MLRKKNIYNRNFPIQINPNDLNNISYNDSILNALDLNNNEVDENLKNI